MEREAWWAAVHRVTELDLTENAQKQMQTDAQVQMLSLFPQGLTQAT